MCEDNLRVRDRSKQREHSRLLFGKSNKSRVIREGRQSVGAEYLADYDSFGFKKLCHCAIDRKCHVNLVILNVNHKLIRLGVWEVIKSFFRIKAFRRN